MTAGTTPDYQVNLRDPLPFSCSSHHLVQTSPMTPIAGRDTIYLNYGSFLTAPSRVSLLQRPRSPNRRSAPSPRGHRTPPRKPTPPAKRSAARQASPSPSRRPSRIGGSGSARGQPSPSRRPARRAASPTARGPPRTRGSGYRQVEPGHPDLCPQTSMTLEIHSPQTVPPPKGLQDLRFPPPPSTDRHCPQGGDKVLLCCPLANFSPSFPPHATLLSLPLGVSTQLQVKRKESWSQAPCHPLRR